MQDYLASQVVEPFQLRRRRDVACSERNGETLTTRVTDRLQDPRLQRGRVSKLALEAVCGRIVAQPATDKNRDKNRATSRNRVWAEKVGDHV